MPLRGPIADALELPRVAGEGLKRDQLVARTGPRR
jgi:hypothetical protein